MKSSLFFFPNLPESFGWEGKSAQFHAEDFWGKWRWFICWCNYWGFVGATNQIEVHVQIDARRGDSNQTSGYTTGCSCSYFLVKDFFIVLFVHILLILFSQKFLHSTTSYIEPWQALPILPSTAVGEAVWCKVRVKAIHVRLHDIIPGQKGQDLPILT